MRRPPVETSSLSNTKTATIVENSITLEQLLHESTDFTRKAPGITGPVLDTQSMQPTQLGVNTFSPPTSPPAMAGAIFDYQHL